MRITAFLLFLVMMGATNAATIFVDSGESRKVFGEFDPDVTIDSLSIESDGGIYFGLRAADMEDTEYVSIYIGVQSELFFISGGVGRLEDEVPLLATNSVAEVQGGIQYSLGGFRFRMGLRHISDPEEIDDGRDFVFVAAGVQF
ncbi:MAG: hypothetical protein OEV07_03975 [Gammaproteobacteria bacterium]|nr:hypothetical protein [Gammaproteobacteria bacterium]